MDGNVYMDRQEVSFSLYSSSLNRQKRPLRTMSFDCDKRHSSSKPIYAQSPLKRRRLSAEESDPQLSTAKKSSPDTISVSKKRRNHPGWNQWVNPEKEVKDVHALDVKDASHQKSDKDEQKAQVTAGDEPVNLESKTSSKAHLPLNSRSTPSHPNRPDLTIQCSSEDSEANLIETQQPKVNIRIHDFSLYRLIIIMRRHLSSLHLGVTTPTRQEPRAPSMNDDEIKTVSSTFHISYKYLVTSSSTVAEGNFVFSFIHAYEETLLDASTSLSLFIDIIARHRYLNIEGNCSFVQCSIHLLNSRISLIQNRH